MVRTNPLLVKSARSRLSNDAARIDSLLADLRSSHAHAIESSAITYGESDAIKAAERALKEAINQLRAHFQPGA